MKLTRAKQLTATVILWRIRRWMRMRIENKDEDDDDDEDDER